VAGAGRGSFQLRFAQPSRDAQRPRRFLSHRHLSLYDQPEKDPKKTRYIDVRSALSNKGIEVMIDAMPLILKERPDAVYVVLVRRIRTCSS